MFFLCCVWYCKEPRDIPSVQEYAHRFSAYTMGILHMKLENWILVFEEGDPATHPIQFMGPKGSLKFLGSNPFQVR